MAVAVTAAAHSAPATAMKVVECVTNCESVHSPWWVAVLAIGIVGGFICLMAYYADKSFN